MSLFKHKTPEEKEAEMARYEQEIQEANRRKAEEKQRRKAERQRKKEAKRNGQKPTSKQSQQLKKSMGQTVEETQPEVKPQATTIQRNRLKQMEEDSARRKKEDKASLVKRLNQRQVTLIKEKQHYQEIISRLSREALKAITENANNSKDLFDFYRKTADKVTPEALIALKLVSPAEKELFDYVLKNDLSTTLYQGKTRLFNKALQQAQREDFQAFSDSHAELINRLKTGKEQIEERALARLPVIYVLGRPQDVELVEMFSLPTAIRPLLTVEDIKIFEQDDKKKCVLMFKQCNTELAPEFKRISKEQKFKSLLTFNLHNGIQATNEIVPFNREALLQKIS